MLLENNCNWYVVKLWNCGILLLLSIQCVKTIGANRGVDLQTVTDEYVSTKLNEKVEICVQFDL